MRNLKATAAAYNLSVRAQEENGVLTLTPGALSTSGALYDENYQTACGLRLRFAEGTDPAQIRTDANVVKWQDDALYISMDRPVQLRFDGQGADSRLLAVNLPADIAQTASGATLQFRDGGMMQVSVSGAAESASPGWTAQQENGVTTFTKFGPADTLDITY